MKEEPAEEAEAKISCGQWHRHLRRQGHRQPPLEIRAAPARFLLRAISTSIRTGTRSGPRTASRAISLAPQFGHAHEVFNVIDSRQAYPQQVVVEALRALGYTTEADNLKHFRLQRGGAHAALRARDGLRHSPRRRQAPLIEVSGRKGQGVKADDLLDQLEASARKEVDDAARRESRGGRARSYLARHRHRGAALFSAALHALQPSSRSISRTR